MKILVILISLLSIAKSQKNLSPYGTASQSSTYYWTSRNLNLTADLAITGGRTHNIFSESCSTTLYKPTQYVAWWMLTFPVDTIYITNVRIYFRSSDESRLAGYSLYVSNSSTTKTDGYLCYHHTGPQLPTSVLQIVNCDQLGQNVIFYNERDEGGNNTAGYSDEAMILLCNIEVNGCFKGWWDSTCSNPCPVTCVSGHCYPGNGSCVWGCNPDNCLNDTCDIDTGKCTQGCKIGLRGDYCDKECILGHYGYNCEDSCDGCLLDSCDREHGVCTDTTACKHGRQPGELMKCDKACGSGTFGNQCSSNCHCVNQPCDAEDGTCPAGGCERGYKGSPCSTDCTSGDYGYNCEHHCRICVNSSCERYEGLCTYGCIDGLKGLQCQSAVTPQSDGQTTNDSTMNMVYTGVVTFIVTTLMCVIIVLAILRYRRNKTHGNTTKQGEQKSRGFSNGAFTNDYANTLASNTETHYEDTIHSDQEQDETYDTI